nr:glutamate-5-semialdehyde dehydrogenase [Microthrixaceae bacterium]
MPVTPIPELARRAKAASRRLATASTALKDEALLTAADLLEARSADVLAANSLDVAGAEGAGIPTGLVDRLRLTEDRVAAMASGLRQVAALADPVGEVLDGWVRPNGLRISRVRVPLGVVAIIYESRPNVTSDAAGLCLKSGNAAFLRGSSTAVNSNLAIAAVLREAVAKAGLPEDSVIVVEDTSRDAAVEFMQQEGLVDCLIPRGGASLIASIKQHATVPFVIDGDGNCHVYVDAAADLDMAETIVLNAKTQRPSVCNAAESLVVHAQVAAQILPRLDTALADVELVGDARARALVPRMGEATDEDYAREFLDMRMSV